MSKHTPGPWAAGAFHVHSAESVICDCVLSQNANLPTEEKIANIRLIAAAPDLLEALDGILNDVKGVRGLTSPCAPSQDQIRNAIAALAKARGEEE
jgi:hypothetical protein